MIFPASFLPLHKTFKSYENFRAQTAPPAVLQLSRCIEPPLPTKFRIRKSKRKVIYESSPSLMRIGKPEFKTPNSHIRTCLSFNHHTVVKHSKTPFHIAPAFISIYNRQDKSRRLKDVFAATLFYDLFLKNHCDNFRQFPFLKYPADCRRPRLRGTLFRRTKKYIYIPFPRSSPIRGRKPIPF